MNNPDENGARAVVLNAGFDQSLIPEQGNSIRYLVVEIKAPPAILTGREPPPLNVAFVIDRSGSMSRGKLEKAKEAASQVVESFGHKDHFSLVSFDDKVETHFPYDQENNLIVPIKK